MKTYALLLASVCVLMASCKKSHTDPVLPPLPTGYLLDKITDDIGQLTVAYQYDQSNHLIKMDFYDIRSFNKHTTTTYTYNSAGQADTMKVTPDSFAATGHRHIYKYNSSGQMIKKFTLYAGETILDDNGYDYSYNALGEVTSCSASGEKYSDYVYDAAGNVVKENDYVLFSGQKKIITSEFTYDNHPRPSTYLDYLPEDNTFPIQFVPQRGILAENLSRNNITIDKVNGITYSYIYNTEGYPASITIAYNNATVAPYTIHLTYKKAN